MTRRTFAELSDIFRGMANAKQQWLRVHGPKRGEMDRAQRQIEFEACEQAASDYAAAAARDERKQAHGTR